MDWIFDNPKGLIIVGFVIFSVIKHILEAKKNAEAEAEADDPFENWEEPKQPRQVTLPPPIRSRAIPPPLHASEPEGEVLLKRQQDMMDRLRLIKESNQEKAVTVGGAAATRSRIAGGNAPKPAVQIGLRAMLRDPAQTRRAIVLREILGPPVGLR